MSKKMVSCRTCGADIAKSAKVCPSCGAKNKKPIYKRWWVWVLVFVIVAGMFGSSGDTDQVEASAPTAPTQTEPAPVAPVEPEPEPEVVYTEYTVKQLMDDLKANALKAEQTYDGQYVELSGVLSVIDSDGKYIGIAPPDAWGLENVLCYIQNEEQLNAVLEMKKGDFVTLRGKITDVGEVLGYVLDIAEFVTE